MEEKTGEPTTSTAHVAYSTNLGPRSYQLKQPLHEQHQMHTVSTSGGYTSFNNEGGDRAGGEAREGSQLEVSIDIDEIPGKGPGGVPEKYFTVSVLQDKV